jgi:hypothetical protein
VLPNRVCTTNVEHVLQANSGSSRAFGVDGTDERDIGPKESSPTDANLDAGPKTRLTLVEQE